MAAAAQGVADYFGKNIIYINVMYNMSVDCDCDSHPTDPKLNDRAFWHRPTQWPSTRPASTWCSTTRAGLAMTRNR